MDAEVEMLPRFYCTLFEDWIRLMKKVLPALVFVIFTCVTSNTLFAAELLKDDHPDRYVVVKGDTLWDIASMFLTDAWLWPDIWHVNPDIENPHLIFPGDIIILRYVDGVPQLSLQRGKESRTVVAQPRQQVRRGGGTQRLEPRIRVSPLVSAIPAISFDRLSNLLPIGRIVGRDTLEDSPYILSSMSGRLLFGPRDSFYGRGKWTQGTSIYGVYREGQTYVDPKTHEILGYEARELGYAKVIVSADDVQTFELVTVKEDIRLGDRLLPTEERRVESSIFPSPPDSKIEGVILGVLAGVIHIGRSDVIVFNRGLKHGLDIGSVLAIYKKGERIKDRFGGGKVRLPSERAGILLTVRSYEKMSYGFVLESNFPIKVGDLVLNP